MKCRKEKERLTRKDLGIQDSIFSFLAHDEQRGVEIGTLPKVSNERQSWT